MYEVRTAKSFSELVEKFNPYHDRLGRFATSGGFMNSAYTGDPDKQARTFSANPNTRAGAMAIARASQEGNHPVVGSAYGKTTIPEPKKQPPKKAEKPKTKKPKKEIEQKEDENGFKPAKTKKEAIEYAKNNLNIPLASYGNCDIDTINHINQEITAIQKKYPQLKDAVQSIDIDNRTGIFAAAGTSTSGRCTFYIGHKQYAKGIESLEKSYQSDVDSGFHPKNTDYKSIIWHEYGHIYAYTQYKAQMGFKPKDILGFMDGFDYSANVKSRSFEKAAVRDAAKSLKITQKELKSRISRYAEKNPAETFAEAFAEFNNSPNPRPECIALMKAAGIFK